MGGTTCLLSMLPLKFRRPLFLDFLIPMSSRTTLECRLNGNGISFSIEASSSMGAENGFENMEGAVAVEVVCGPGLSGGLGMVGNESMSQRDRSSRVLIDKYGEGCVAYTVATSNRPTLRIDDADLRRGVLIALDSPAFCELLTVFSFSPGLAGRRVVVGSRRFNLGFFLWAPARVGVINEMRSCPVTPVGSALDFADCTQLDSTRMVAGTGLGRKRCSIF